MSGTRDTTTDGIELHFCRDCGISIPIADIESGRANPALPGCAYSLERCANRNEAPLVEGPTAPRSGRAPASADAGGGGLRLVAAVALLYVVGCTTFLLIRELRREPPEIVLPSNIANVSDVEALQRRFRELEEQARTTREQLTANDTRLEATLATIRQRTHELTDALRRTADASVERDRALSRGLLSLTEETLGLKTPLGEILRRLDELAQSPPSRGGTPTVKDRPGEGTPKADRPPEEDPKLRAQVDEFIKQLTDRSASDQTRYNAAVQLGDLGHPAAVAPLVQALEKDPYDLVKRAAAFSLGMLGKHSVSAIPVLIAGVSEKEEYVGYMCARALGEIAKATLGQEVEFGYDPTMSAKQRREVRDRWQQWWDKNRSLVESS